MSRITVSHYENYDIHHTIDFNGREQLDKYDKNKKLIYRKDCLGTEYWYDRDGNEIHYKSHEGMECWSEYDENNNLIHHKINDGREFFYKYKERVEYDRIKMSKQEFEEEKVDSRLEILDL